MSKRKATNAAPAEPLKAQGNGKHKRTPQSAFDSAAGKDPEEPELDVKLLSWWAAKESRWPNLCKAILCKMVKQWLAAPASSAGVERVFSAAGKMHGDLSKSAKDDTLEHSLFAAFNTD